MKVELEIDWGALPKESRPDPKPRKRYPAIPSSRAERRLYFIALGRHIEEAVDSGDFESLAVIAHACGVSRARISQVANLMRASAE